MTCKKKNFNSIKEANERAQQINKKISRDKIQKEKLSPYKCEFCDGFHLTKMSKHKYKVINDIEYRVKVREINFIESNSSYYNSLYGVDD